MLASTEFIRRRRMVSIESTFRLHSNTKTAPNARTAITAPSALLSECMDRNSIRRSRRTTWVARGSLSGCEIPLLELHVVPRGVVEPLDFLIAQHAHAPRGIADPELAFADDLTGRDDRAGADDRVPADDGAVEHGRVHADQARVFHGTCVHDRTVADGD